MSEIEMVCRFVESTTKQHACSWNMEGLQKGVDDIRALTKQKDGAYSERDQLVALVSKCFPAWLERHPESDTTWEDDWRWIVFIKLPTGQASWHIHDSELPWFDHLQRNTEHSDSWDGHTTEEKYKRVAAVPDGWHFELNT